MSSTITTNNDEAAFEADAMLVECDELGTYRIEVLTRAEWEALAPEDGPDEFYRHRPDVYVRFSCVEGEADEADDKDGD
jgi:hypothetical protein